MTCIVQQSEEWISLRKDKIGASDAPVIMGVSPFKTALQLWEEKLGFRENKKTERMQRGLDMEEEARQSFETDNGILVIPMVIFHPKHSWMMASLDGMDIERKNAVEIKCPGQKDHSIAESGKVPEHYYPQLQHQMAVAGLNYIYYYSYFNKKGITLRIERDQEYINNLIEKEEKFLNCLYELIRPQEVLKDYILREDDIWKETATRWLEIQAQKKNLETQEEELREMLISMSGDYNTMGFGVKVSKVVRKGNIEYSKIPELTGLDLEKHRKKPTTYWKIGDAA